MSIVIPTVSAAGSLLAIAGVYLDGRQSKAINNSPRRDHHSESERALVEVALMTLGVGLAGIVTATDPSEIVGWAAGRTQLSRLQILQLTVALSAFTIIEQSEGSSFLAAEWLISDAGLPGDSPSERLQRGEFSDVLSAAQTLAARG